MIEGFAPRSLACLAIFAEAIVIPRIDGVATLVEGNATRLLRLDYSWPQA
jgi:hypothetical protein